MDGNYKIIDTFIIEKVNSDKMVIAFDRKIDLADYYKKEVVIDSKPTTYELTHNEWWIIIPKTDSDVLGKMATFR